MDNKKCELTNSQLGIYLECINQTKKAGYLIPLTLNFPKMQDGLKTETDAKSEPDSLSINQDGQETGLDARKLAEAFDKVANFYSAFRTVIAVENGSPVMYQTEEKIPGIKIFNIREDEIDTYKNALLLPFTFDGKLLWRAEILQTEKQIILATVFHHNIFDGTSELVLNRAIAAAYAGEELTETKNLFDCKAAETEMLESEVEKEAAKYFEAYFDGYDSDSNIRPDRASQGVTVYSTASYPVNYTCDEIKAFAKENGVTENIVFMSAFIYALGKFNNQNESIFASVESGRFGGGYENSIGMFVKSFPLRFGIDEQLSASDFVKYVKQNYFDTLRHNHTDYMKLVKDHPGCSDIEFIYQGDILEGFPVGGVVPSLNVLDSYEPVSNLNVLLFKLAGVYQQWIGYRGDMYSREMIDSFANLYDKVISELLSGKKLCEFDLVSDKSRAFIDASNRTEDNSDASRPIAELFTETVRRFPENVAVSYKNVKYSYAELYSLSRKLAAYINKKGLGHEDFVPILIPRNEYMPICAMGVILAGAAYQPLDPSYPEERLNFMVTDSKARLLIADRRLFGSVPEYHGDVLFTDEIEALEDPGSDSFPVKNQNSEAAALLIYTSGTTGTPKGCILENKNVVGFCNNHRKYVELSEKSKVATIASFGFDAAAMDIFSTLLSGAELCIIPEEIKLDIPEVEKFYIENGITNGFMTTQLGRMFLEQTKCRTLRHFVLGGEKLVPFNPPAWVVCHNDYGPSESIAYVCGYVIKDNSLIQPIGKPSNNIKLYIIDAYGRMLPTGAAGELCISGVQVGRGYLGRPEKTAEAFIKNPFCENQEYSRLYRTGDVVRMLPDGNYDFVGRRDGQVKIRGFRIELTEIEQLIREYKGVKNATVQAFDDPSAGKFIAAYVVSDEKINIEDFNNFILEQKPAYMVPAVTMQVENIPVNANGKVDKKKLPKPERRYEDAVKPENETQQTIFDAVAKILGSDTFGIDTDLYIAGLSSIGSIRLCSALADSFGIAVQMKDIRTNNTVRKLEGFVIKSGENDCGASDIAGAYKDCARRTPDIQNAEEPAKANVNCAKQESVISSCPLTKTQEGILVECISKPDSTFYNIPLLMKISPEIDIEKLKKAIVSTVNAHPYLEAELFTGTDGVVRQRNSSAGKFNESDVEIISVSSEAEIKENAVTPFTLMNSRLFRFRIYITDKNAGSGNISGSTYLFFEIHHIIADGTSMDILIRDIETAYNGGSIRKEAFDSFRLALDEAQKRSSKLFDEAKDYYKNLLEGLDMNFLPGADRLPEVKKSSGSYSCTEMIANAARCAEYCRQNKLSLNGLLCGAFGFTLAKYAGTDYSVFNTVYNGRNDSRAAETVGMLVKTLPIVCHIDKDKSIDVAKEVTDELLDSMSNDLYSFAEISRNLGVKNEIVFIFQGDSFNFDSFCGKEAEKTELELSESKMPLCIQVAVENGRFRYIAEYSADLYTEAFIRSFVAVLDKVISAFAEGENIADITLLTPEIAADLDKINDTEFPYDTTKTIADYYAEQAKKHPDTLAVVYKDKSYTYAAAYDISRRIAAYLNNKGIGRGDIVSILIPRDETMLLSAHGAIMSGAAYLGLDPGYPKERINFMLQDSGTRLLIVNRALRDIADEYTGEILYTDEFESLPMAKKEFNNCTPDNVALVVYSSGTTGVPKGAQICHKNVVCFYQNYSRDMGLSEKAKVAMYASFGFDGGAMDVFCCPMAGGTLYIIPDDIRLDLEQLEQFYIRNEITSGFMTTQVGTMFIRNTACKTLHHFMVGGEKLIPVIPPEGVVFNNGYGPSETMCYVNRYAVKNAGSLQPIGKPNRNIKEYVIDKFGHRLPFGACGELCISGGQTGIGYLNRPEKTAASFVVNPFCSEKTYERMYKTGDVVRQMPDGNYVFEGRRDGQVKIRGFRIELSEVEQIIREYPTVRNVAVQAYDSPAGGKFIAAYITADEKVDVGLLNSFIASKKPDYMVPAVTMQIDEIPLTANGKVDKRKLPAPTVTNERKGAEPANETEETICGIFGDVLGLEKVYADDDFFHIGGSSISAIQAVVKCNNAGYDIVFKNLFANPTPHSLSEYILGRRDEDTFAPAAGEADQFDYSALSHNKVDFVDEIKSGTIGDVLLTGSTGFLGSHILKELLDNTPSKVICLVRSKDGMDAQTRLQMMMTYYFEDWYTPEKSCRVTVIDGELGDADAMQELKRVRFDTIINSAANVKHFAAGDELLKDNFSGVENLISLAEETGTVLVQISSTSVSGEAVEGKVSDDYKFLECDLNIGQSLENKYVYSKYQAEQAIIDAISRGRIRGKIIRLGNLQARFGDSEFQINASSNGFLKHFSGYSKLGMFPVNLMDKEIEFSPIDATAKAVVLLSGTPDEFTVFHAKNCNSIHMGYLIRAMQKCGIDVKIVSDAYFAETVREKLESESDVFELSSLIAYRDNAKAGEGEKTLHQIDSDSTFTTKALYRLGFAWPLVSSEYLEKMVETLIALGFFE